MNHVPFSWPQLLIIAWGFASTFLSHLVTTYGLPPASRKAITYAISALGAALIQVIYAPGMSWKAYLAAIFYAWVAMLVAHFTGAPDKLNEETPNLGIGPKVGGPNDGNTEYYAGVAVTQSSGPPPPAQSPGPAREPRQSRLKSPRDFPRDQT